MSFEDLIEIRTHHLKLGPAIRLLLVPTHGNELMRSDTYFQQHFYRHQNISYNTYVKKIGDYSTSTRKFANKNY